MIIRFGIEGTVLIGQEDRPGAGEAYLICEPAAIEDDREAAQERYMPGSTSAFTAGLAAALLDLTDHDRDSDPCTPRVLLRAIQSGMVAAARLVQHGFVIDGNGTAATSRRGLAIPLGVVFARTTLLADAGALFAELPLPLRLPHRT